MKRMKEKLFISGLLISQLLAVGEAGAIFLLIAPGAGPAGTGEAQVAKADDAYASFYNPAGLAFLKGREAAGMHVNWLPNLADDLYYEFLAYRHEYPGLGTFGGHIIFLNLGEQLATDDLGNILGDFTSWMGAITGSFGTTLTPSSSIGLSFKLLHQSLAPFGAGSEESDGASTDFAFDLGYMKKWKKQPIKIENVENLFEQVAQLYSDQKELNISINEKVDFIENLEYEIESQKTLKSQLIKLTKKFKKIGKYEELINLEEGFNATLSDMSELINILVEVNIINIQDSLINQNDFDELNNEVLFLSDRILSEIMEVNAKKDDLLTSISQLKFDNKDKLNFGLAVTNIGPPIWFKDQNQADPAPTNMRLGIFANLYDDGFNKVNFLFDANKMLVSRYPSMDWNGDGIISGDKEQMHDDPWYLAIFTAWLDDWYFGGDYDINGDGIIGGWNWEADCETDDNGNQTNDPVYDLDCDNSPTDEELIQTPNNIGFDNKDYGEYNDGDINGNIEKEKGTSEDRTFMTELEEMIYNVGFEYWYTESFGLRGGYIYDYEGKIFNPTFGAGIRLLKYGFDFGYTAGKQGHPRANTMFFSINIEL